MDKYINISSMIVLLVAILMFEIGYRKDKGKIFICGIEILGLAIFILLAKHLPKILECDIKTYIETGVYAIIAYYILKVAILYKKKKRDELKSLRDIKEIVKEEPTKKATKRKNIKEEEGK